VAETDQMRSEIRRLNVVAAENDEQKAQIERLESAIADSADLKDEIRNLQAAAAENQNLKDEIARLASVADENDILKKKIQDLQQRATHGDDNSPESTARGAADSSDIAPTEKDTAQVKQLVAEIQRLQIETADSKKQAARQLQQLEEGTAKFQALAPAHKKLKEEAAKARQLAVKVQRLEQEAAKAKELTVKALEREQDATRAHEITAKMTRREQGPDDVNRLRAEIGRLQEEAVEAAELKEEVRRLHILASQAERLKGEVQRLHKDRKDKELLETEIRQLKQNCKSMAQTTGTLRAKVHELAHELNHNGPSAAHDGVKTGGAPATVSARQERDSGSDTDSMLTLSEAAANAENAGDNLQAIKGVGEVLEGKLRELGITSYRSILEMGPEDYLRAAKLIPNLEGRVNRDGWVAQARVLHQKKYAEAI